MINSWDDLIAIRDELACGGDPVDLLSGSFTWNYRDLALYGKDDLEFTRYYESAHAEKITGLAAAGRPTSPMRWNLTAAP